MRLLVANGGDRLAAVARFADRLDARLAADQQPEPLPREWLVIIPIVAMAILMGVLPNLFLRPIEPAVQRMLSHVEQGSAPARIQARTASPEPRAQSGASRVTSLEPRVAK